jgi:hypothetical protein
MALRDRSDRLQAATPQRGVGRVYDEGPIASETVQNVGGEQSR